MGVVTKSSRLMSFRLPLDVAKRLEEYAASTGQSMSAIVAAAVEYHCGGNLNKGVVIYDSENITEGGTEE